MYLIPFGNFPGSATIIPEIEDGNWIFECMNAYSSKIKRKDFDQITNWQNCHEINNTFISYQICFVKIHLNISEKISFTTACNVVSLWKLPIIING